MQADLNETRTASSASTRLREKTIATRSAFEGVALKVEVLGIEMPDGRHSTREVVRIKSAVAVLGRLPDGRFLFVRQYRKAIEQAFLEVVAGGIEADEAPDVCAHREVREESGYAIHRLLPLGTVVPCPGYSNEHLHLFYADLEAKPGARELDGDENIETLLLCEAAVEDAMRDGTIMDAKTLCCWQLWRLRGPQ